jgi:hypothetical protein
MENTTKDAKGTISHEVAQVPAEVGTTVVHGAENVGHEVAKLVVEGVTVVVNATKTAVGDIAQASEQLGRDAKQAVSPTPDPDRTPVAPPVGALGSVPAPPVAAEPNAVAPVVAPEA